MEINWKKKLIHFKNGNYVCFGIKRRKYWFKNESELKMNEAIVNYFEGQIETLEKVIQDHKDFESDMHEYIHYLQRKCNIPEGNFCEIVTKDGTKYKFLRYKDNTHKEIQYDDGK